MREPEDNAEDHETAKHGDGPVHRLRGWPRAWRPEGEESPDYAVDNGEYVDVRSCPPELERSPSNLMLWRSEALV